MTKKLASFKALLVAVACGGAPLITEVTCDPYYGFGFYRDDDSGDCCYDDYYYDDYYYEPYCDDYYCY